MKAGITNMLYKFIDTNRIYTFEELKELYEIVSVKKIDDETMKSIIFENLWQNGGNIEEMEEMGA